MEQEFYPLAQNVSYPPDFSRLRAFGRDNLWPTDARRQRCNYFIFGFIFIIRSEAGW